MWLADKFLNLAFPRPVSCNSDAPEQTEDSQFDMDPMDPFRTDKKKVPPFEQVMVPILAVTSHNDFIRGFKFDFGMPLSETFSFVHSWTIPNSGSLPKAFNPMAMPTSNKPTYQFTTQLVRDIQMNEPRTVMMGNFDNEGKVQAYFIRKLTNNLTLSLQGAFMSSNVEQGMISADLQYQDNNTHCSLKYNPSQWGLSYMQKINRNIMLGFDYNNVSMQGISGFGYAMKAFIGKNTLYSQYMPLLGSFHLGYLFPLKKNTTLISHYKFQKNRQQSTAILGFKQRGKDFDVVTSINSRFKIMSQVTFKHPLYSLKLCAMNDYTKEQYAFGYGVTIGQIA